MSIKKISTDLEVSSRIQRIYSKSRISASKSKHNNSNIFRNNISQYSKPQINYITNPIRLPNKRIVFNPASTSSSQIIETTNFTPVKPVSSPSKKYYAYYTSSNEKNAFKSRLATSSSTVKLNTSQRNLNQTSPPYNKPFHRKSSSQCDLGFKPYEPKKNLKNAGNPLSISQSSNPKMNINSSGYYNDTLIKLEDLILIDERLNAIIRGIYNDNNNYAGGVSDECFEWWMFYYNSSLVEKYKHFFWDTSYEIIIKSTNNLELFAIMLTYDISNNGGFLKAFRVILKSIFNLIRSNFLLITRQIISTVSRNERNSVYYDRLNTILIANQISEMLQEDDVIKKIKQNSIAIVDYIKIIILQYQNCKMTFYLELTDLFNNISKITNEDLKDFFFDNIVRLNMNRSLITLTRRHKRSEFREVEAPYIKKPLLKRFCLVLDLDETLINFKFNSANENSGTLFLRPGLIDFLSSVRKYYEVVSFTAGTKDYAEPILDSIETEEKFFDYRLYREHAVIIGKDFVKDISRIGRDMSRIVIVDNMAMNFRLNKENGILIYPYYFQDKNDTSLYELRDILLKMAVEYTDIRKGLVKYRNEICLKVSSNINNL